METAGAAVKRGRRRMSLRQLSPLGPKRPVDPVDADFEEFYREHVAEVYQYALAVLTNPADAEDVTQATFLNAYRAFQRGERPRVAHNWLIKIAHNVCRMRWRQAKRRPQEVPLEPIHEPAVVDDDKPTVDDVLRALSVLPFNQRAALVMREVEGRNYNEIADVLGTSVAAVEALLFRARQKLRVHRKSIGVLSTAPVPGSLGSFFGGGSVVGGGALATGVALKAAAVVATGVVAGGLGFKTVHAIADPASPRGSTPPVALDRGAPRWSDPVRRLITAEIRQNPAARARAAAAVGSPRAPGRNGRAPADGATTASPEVPTIPGNPDSAPPSPGSGSNGGPASGPVSTVHSTLPVSVPSTPVPTPPAPLPPPPPLPVTVPPPPVTLPTVTVPKLP
jgi:RNA polymerase sigma-70 factor (ECF subfamily)